MRDSIVSSSIMSADQVVLAGGGGVDHISDLPDHLLHDVLLRLPGTADAARTSVLSRRWRRVWTHLPALSLDYTTFRPPSSTAVARAVAGVDAFLAAERDAGSGTSTTLSRLEIAFPPVSLHLPMDCVSAWLLLASRRLAGKLRLELPYSTERGRGEDEEVLLPLCERATSIRLDLKTRVLRFAGGVFRALASLRISIARVDAGELEAAVSSSRCPCLKKLVLRGILVLHDDRRRHGRELSIRSESLERLQVSLFHTHRLHVDAPKLQVFHSPTTHQLCVVAPKLSELCWYGHDYDPSRHRLPKPEQQLRRLVVDANSVGSALMHQFNTVDELHLTIDLSKGVQTYERFLQDTDKLAKCKVLRVRFSKLKHGFKPAMLHLLRKCAGVRRLVVQLSGSYSMNDYPCKLSSGCPCSRPESCKTQDVTLDSLEEVVIEDNGEVDRKVELVRLLCRCSTTFHKRVSITVLESERIYDMRKKIQGIRLPNDKVEIVVRPRELEL